MSALKSTRGPLGESYPAPASDPDVPPSDGAPLAEFYAWEERRVAAMREGRAGAFAYLWCPQLSLSVSRREARRLGVETLDFDAEEVAVRATGGTAVPQGPGTLNLSLFTLHDTHPGIGETYRVVCAALADAFAALGMETTVGAREGSFCDGDYNLLWENRKLVGTAQRWANRRGGAGVIGHHHCAILSGGEPDWLCSRTEALYAAAGLDVRYDREAHSGRPVSARDLGHALRGPVGRVLGCDSFTTVSAPAA